MQCASKQNLFSFYLSSSLKNGYIIVQVEDNGIGRSRAVLLKTNNPIHKISLGIKVTQDRISIFNNLNQDKNAQLEIQDLHKGTRVVIILPQPIIHSCGIVH